MGKGPQIAVGALLVLALLGWVGWSEFESGSFVYYQTLDEFQASARPDRPSRVHGFVSPGSIERDVAARVVRFRVQATPPHASGTAEHGLAVTYQSLETPDMFKDGAEVVVEGSVPRGGDRFVASNVLAKCPSKFEARQEAAATL